MDLIQPRPDTNLENVERSFTFLLGMVGFGCVVWIIFGLVFFSSGEVLYIVIYKDLIKYLDAQATLKNCMNVIELGNKISKQVVLICKKKKSKTYD